MPEYLTLLILYYHLQNYEKYQYKQNESFSSPSPPKLGSRHEALGFRL